MVPELGSSNAENDFAERLSQKMKISCTISRWLIQECYRIDVWCVNLSLAAQATSWDMFVFLSRIPKCLPTRNMKRKQWVLSHWSMNAATGVWHVAWASTLLVSGQDTCRNIMMTRGQALHATRQWWMIQRRYGWTFLTSFQLEMLSGAVFVKVCSQIKRHWISIVAKSRQSRVKLKNPPRPNQNTLLLRKEPMWNAQSALKSSRHTLSKDIWRFFTLCQWGSARSVT